MWKTTGERFDGAVFAYTKHKEYKPQILGFIAIRLLELLGKISVCLVQELFEAAHIHTKIYWDYSLESKLGVWRPCQD